MADFTDATNYTQTTYLFALGVLTGFAPADFAEVAREGGMDEAVKEGFIQRAKQGLAILADVARDEKTDQAALVIKLVARGLEERFAALTLDACAKAVRDFDAIKG